MPKSLAFDPKKMNEAQAALQAQAAKLLSEGAVAVFLGHEEGWDGLPVPFFATTPEEAKRLVWNPLVAFNLAKYLLDKLDGEEKVGIVVNGCGSLALDRILKDRRFKRERLFVVGIPCTGLLDPETGLYLKRCSWCDTPNPVIADVLIGEKAPEEAVPQQYPRVDELEKMSPAERAEHFKGLYEKCIRCFACRNVCPACTCRECSLDQWEPSWLGRATVPSEQFMFHFIRAFDVAGRCIRCGECERVCSVGVPLMELNDKFLKDITELFGVQRPHVPTDVEPLGQWTEGDPDLEAAH